MRGYTLESTIKRHGEPVLMFDVDFKDLTRIEIQICDFPDKVAVFKIKKGEDRLRIDGCIVYGMIAENDWIPNCGERFAIGHLLDLKNKGGE